MISITLVDGKVFRLKLKSKEEEQRFRDAWYSMSDMPRYKNKELEAVTEQDQKHVFKIKDILNCFIQEASSKTYSAESVKKATEMNDKADQIIGISVEKESKEKANPTLNLHDDEEEETEALFNIPEDGTLEFIEFIKELSFAVNSVFDKLPEKQRRNIVSFVEGLKLSSLHIDLSDPVLIELASKAFNANSTLEIARLVWEYGMRQRRS